MEEISGAQQTGEFEEKYVESCSYVFVSNKGRSKASSSSYVLHIYSSVDATKQITGLCRSKVQSTQSRTASSTGISGKLDICAHVQVRHPD